MVYFERVTSRSFVNGHRTPETDRCSLLETIEFSVVTFTSMQTLIVVFFV